MPKFEKGGGGAERVVCFYLERKNVVSMKRDATPLQQKGKEKSRKVRKSSHGTETSTSVTSSSRGGDKKQAFSPWTEGRFKGEGRNPEGGRTYRER